MTNEYSNRIENLLSPLVGDLMAKMALKSQCKALGISPEDIGPQHLEPLAKRIGFALGIQGHRDKAETIVSAIKNISIAELVKRGKVKGTIMSSVIEHVSLRWGAGLAQELKGMTGQPESFKPSTWHTLVMLEGILERLEKAKGQGTKSLSYDIGYQLMSNLKFENARYLFSDTEKSVLDTFSNLKLYFDITEMRVTKASEREIIIAHQEETTQHLNQFIMGLCEGILKLGNKSGRIQMKESSANSTVISVKID